MCQQIRRDLRPRQRPRAVQLRAQIRDLLAKIVEEDLLQNQLESELRFDEVTVSLTRELTMELQVAQLEAELYNRPIDLRDKVEALVQKYVGQLFLQHLHEITNEQWDLAAQSNSLIMKIDEHSQKRSEIRQRLIIEMGLA